jgi:hypothetical protein
MRRFCRPSLAVFFRDARVLVELSLKRQDSLSVSDNAYGAKTRTLTVKPDQAVVEKWELASSHHWYDLSVSNSADSSYARR